MPVKIKPLAAPKADMQISALTIAAPNLGNKVDTASAAIAFEFATPEKPRA